MELLKEIDNQKGFIIGDQLDDLAMLMPSQQVLIRCSNGRFICTADNARHFIIIIQNENSDYVRDISMYKGALL